MSDEAHNVAWDDSLLMKTYDESVNLAREALARRLADSTNTRDDPEDEENKTMSATTPEPVHIFKVGDFARATYTDGLDYEGAVVSINEKTETCIIRYLGYENEQEVPLAELLPSWGKKTRREQFLCAKQAEAVQGQQEQQQQQRSKQVTKKASAKNPKTAGNGMPGGLIMPPMPFIPPVGGGGEDGEQDFVAMLTAWYMSGYYTGLYQGKKEAAANQANKKNNKK